jgi:hypothetical protein
VVIDAATGTLAHRLRGFVDPDVVTFTKAFAYVRQRGANTVSMIELNTLGGARAPAVVAFQAGQQPPGEAGLAAPITPLPDGRRVLISNPTEKSLYVYAEGMMAPLGTWLNYGREPLSALIVDRKLHEITPGVYEADVRLPAKGLYDVEVLLDRPRIAVCLERSVASAPGPDEEAAAPRMTMEPLFDPEVHLPAGQPATLSFRLRDPGSPEPVREAEVTALLIRSAGTWQQRHAVLGSPEPGAFEVTFTPPRAGQYKLLAGVESRGVKLGDLPFITLRVGEPAGGEASAEPPVRGSEDR